VIPTTRVKICGLRRREDVLVADAAGADYLGVVLSAGFLRSVDPAAAAELVEDTRAARVAVLVDESARGAADRAEAVAAAVLQLHGAEPVELVRELAAVGRWTLWKSVRVRGPGDVTRAVDAYGPWVDGLLLEGWRDGVVGGGGALLDPAVVGGGRPWFPAGLDLILAGGLGPDSVSAAVARFSPDVVDVSSGVEEAPGTKSPDLVRLFIQRARAATSRPGAIHPDPSPGGAPS
jgi:phosphoribosylanthranilate isomerase